ncbi:MAG: glutamine synthetase family protein [Mangrovibacterium sp.]
MNKKEIIDKIRQSGHQKIKFAISDIDGVLRSKVISREKFTDVLEQGTGFCDVLFGWDVNDACYDNTRFTGWHTGYPDRKAIIDPETFRTIPWEKDIPYFLADFSREDNREVPCPRSLLKKIAGKAGEMGFRAVFAQEFEWYNFSGTPDQLAANGYRELNPITPGMFGYSQLRTSQFQDYYQNLFDLLEKFRIPLESFHTETGPGVYEAAIAHDEVLAAADKAVLFKAAVKEIAFIHGIAASFMAKWDARLPGSGGHLHQSLCSQDNGENLFQTGNSRATLSPVLENYLAGQLFCLREILPMYAPTINSYKRLQLGAWAPSSVSWGHDNRTTAIRLIGKAKQPARLEMRVPGADCNPYLAMAAALASGLYGIRNRLKLNIPESTGDDYSQTGRTLLPSSLEEATRLMRHSALARELFGESFTEHFVQTREWECREFARTVSNWELKRYFEII